MSVNEWFLCLPDPDGEKPEWLVRPSRWDLEQAIERRIASFERSLGRPLANRHLPPDLRLQETKFWLNLENELPEFEHCVWSAVGDVDVAQVLRDIVVVLTGRAGL